jgi:hypothetical protein
MIGHTISHCEILKPLGGLVLLLVLCSVALQAQEHDTSSIGDTSHAHTIVVADPGIALGKATLLLPSSLQPAGRFESFLFSEPNPRIHQPFLQGALAPKVDLLSPYLLQRQQETQLNPLYLILGAMEMGGAAYIAYRHVKKYGFFP